MGKYADKVYAGVYHRIAGSDSFSCNLDEFSSELGIEPGELEYELDELVHDGVLDVEHGIEIDGETWLAYSISKKGASE